MTLVNRKKEIDSESFNRLKESLAALKEQLTDIRSQIVITRNTDGSNLTESSSLLFLLAEQQAKCTEISRLQDELNNIVVVDKKGNNTTIGLGDTVTLEIAYSDGEPVSKKYLLVGTSPDLLKGEISKDSAIGKFVYGKTIGNSGKVVLPNKATATIKIISKE